MKPISHTPESLKKLRAEIEPELYTKFQLLKRAGRLHPRLANRVRWQILIGLALFSVAVFEMVTGVLNPWYCIIIAAVSCISGLLFFTRLLKPVFDYSTEAITTGRLDLFGIVVLMLYFAVDLAVRIKLEMELAGSFPPVGYILLSIGASFLGRSIGTVFAVIRVAQTEGLLNEQKSSH